MKIVLGSSSPWRKKLFSELGLEFETVSPDIDEKAIRRERPEDLVLAIAEAKNLAVRGRLSEPAIVVTSDQVVVADGKVLEKPRDRAEARQFISRAGDHPASTVTAVVAANTATGQTAKVVDAVEIIMDPLPEEIIEELLHQDNIYGCAGGLAIEDPLIQPYIRRVNGGIDSVQGLPKALTRKLIEEVTS
jgi:septum formation protein